METLPGSESRSSVGMGRAADVVPLTHLRSPHLLARIIAAAARALPPEGGSSRRGRWASARRSRRAASCDISAPPPEDPAPPPAGDFGMAASARLQGLLDALRH